MGLPLRLPGRRFGLDELVDAVQDAAISAGAITGGTEVIIGIADDHRFGSLVVFGLGGAASEALADHAARLTPLTDTDADKLIRSIRSSPLLLGHLGRPAADLGALRDLLLRVSRLADDLPEVTGLELTRSSPGQTAYSPWTRESRCRPASRETRSSVVALTYRAHRHCGQLADRDLSPWARGRTSLQGSASERSWLSNRLLPVRTSPRATWRLR
jgi:hypothetical protein